MAISNVTFNGLNAQSVAAYNALQALEGNTDMAKIPMLAAALQAQSSALESMKKALDEATRALAGPK